MWDMIPKVVNQSHKLVKSLTKDDSLKIKTLLFIKLLFGKSDVTLMIWTDIFYRGNPEFAPLRVIYTPRIFGRPILDSPNIPFWWSRTRRSRSRYNFTMYPQRPRNTVISLEIRRCTFHSNIPLEVTNVVLWYNTTRTREIRMDRYESQ